MGHTKDKKSQKKHTRSSWLSIREFETTKLCLHADKLSSPRDKFECSISKRRKKNARESEPEEQNCTKTVNYLAKITMLIQRCEHGETGNEKD